MQAQQKCLMYIVLVESCHFVDMSVFSKMALISIQISVQKTSRKDVQWNLAIKTTQKTGPKWS